MTDLSDVLPNFDLNPWRHLLFSLEKKGITVLELISDDHMQIARKCPLPPKEVARMAKAVLQALHARVGYSSSGISQQHSLRSISDLQTTSYVSTTDSVLDECLGGGFPTGHVTEIVGESAAGKTQFVLSLLLSAQLPAPKGLGRPVIYVSTEDPLNTKRLAQILESHPHYQAIEADLRPSLDHVYTMSAHNLELQEHIIQYQLPVVVAQIRPGLLVMDSVAANYRAEYSSTSKSALAHRAVELVRLGKTLRNLASEYNVAVVVTNQVSDRFDNQQSNPHFNRLQSSSPAPPWSQPTQLPRGTASNDELVSLDHQQRFFTGWGEEAASALDASKSPALGLTWTNQVSARIVLKIATDQKPCQAAHSSIWSDRKRRRYLSLVFAPWVEPSHKPIEYDISNHGISSVTKGNDEGLSGNEAQLSSQDAELLDPRYWDAGTDQDLDSEFP